jgi:hypothetical protein
MVALEPAIAPWWRWDAILPGQTAGPARNKFIRNKIDPGPVPARDEDLAFAAYAPFAMLEERKLSSERLIRFI